MVQGVIHPTFGQFIYNLSNNVGIGQPNRPDDVQLVQLGYKTYAADRAVTVSEDQRAVYARVVPGTPYNAGNPADLLNIAIRTHEAAIGTAFDGHVSVLPHGQSEYGDSQFRLLAYLLASVRRVYQANWPRLDKIDVALPAELRTSVIKIMGLDKIK